MMRRLVWAAVVAATVLPGMVSAQSWRSVTMSRQIQGHDELRVDVEYGAGELSIAPMDEGLLYRMNLRYDEDAFEPVAELSDDRLRLGIESIRRNINIGKGESGRLELELARGVPMELDLAFGAVRANVDLGGLSLTRLDLSTGASESDIDVSAPNPIRMRTATFEVGAADFTARHLGNLNADRIRVDAGVGALSLWFDGEWNRDAEVEIDMGLGSLELVVPEGIGIRVRKDSFLTSFDSEGLVKRGGVYESLDYDDAEVRIDIEVDAAFGSVEVVWIR